jgi:hypothetical protein
MRMLLTSIALLISTATAAIASPDTTGPSDAPRTPRVRSGDSRSATLLSRGLERSATIRGLVSHLERRDVIVYIEMQPTLKRRLAGTLTWITNTPTHRYVRISINPELKTDDAVATLGHELQHALEVAQAPEIVSARTLERYYARHGDISRTERNGWDTEAARLAGNEVRRELAEMRTTRVAESIQ